MRISNNTTDEFKIYRVITQFSPNDVTFTIVENESKRLSIQMTYDEVSLIEHELAHILIILKMRSRLTSAEMNRYRRIVNAAGEKLVGESREMKEEEEI